MGKILVVDDEEETRLVLENILTKEGYAVLKAANGKEALELVQKDIPDLILLDIRMPFMDGYEVCKRLKENKKTETIPIIVITAYPEEKEEALRLGGDDFISKPFEKIDLIVRIRAALRTAHLQDELERAIAYIEELRKEGKI